MSVGLNNYKFGKKNNWRRWSWNECIRRIDKPRPDIICLYLPSEQNIDMGVAAEKGIKPGNMFAVERDENIVKSLRKKGVNVISGDIKDVLLTWGSSPKIDIVHADLCSPLNKWTLSFIRSLVSSNALIPGASVALNLLRGRDRDSNKLRDGLKNVCSSDIERKHRGIQFIYTYVLMALNVFTETAFYKYALERYGGGDKLYEREINYFWMSLAPRFNSYKSSNGVTVMDSVVFERWDNGLMERSFSHDREALGRKIAAAKAIRTARFKYGGKLRAIDE